MSLLSLIKKANRVRRQKGISKLKQKTKSFIFHRYIKYYVNKTYVTLFSNKLKMDTSAGEIEFYVDPEWNGIYYIGTGKTYEPKLLNRLESTLSEEDVFYNVGSRWGIISLFADVCGVECSNIHNFELDEENIQILKRNANENMKINNTRVGESDVKGQITLDSYSYESEPPTVIKMDVEGSELDVIRGSLDLLSKQKPRLFIEVHPDYITRFGGTQYELINILEANDYEISYVDHNTADSKWLPVDSGTLPTEGNYLLHAV